MLGRSVETTMVLVGLGSNLGTSSGIIQRAIVALRIFSCGEVRASEMWRTSPVDCPPGSADFVNAVAAFEPKQDLTASKLLDGLKRLEREFGRDEALVKNAPRMLDLDLLIFGELKINEADLVIPHPRAQERRFVLAPAAEIVPDLIWPGTQCTIGALLESLVSDEVVQQIEIAE